MNVRCAWSGLLLVTAVAAFARPARAAWPHDSATNLQVAPAVAGTDNLPAMTPDGSGGAILAWFDNRAGNSNIYAQHVDNKGVRTWAAGGAVVCNDPGDQTYPCIVSDGAGGAFVSWHDSRSANFDIYAQHLDAKGVAQWAANGKVVCNAALGQYHLATVADGASGLIATWLDERNGDGGDIYAQRLNAAGTALWAANGVAVCTASGVQQIPMPVSDGAGGAIVTWTDARGGGSHVYAQRVSGAGTPQWTANGVALTATGSSTTIVADNAGGAIVTWGDLNSLFAQRVNGAGALLWQAFGVQVCQSGMGQNRPRAISDGAGGAIVTWQDTRASNTTNRPDVYVQRVNGAGALLWPATGVALSTAVAPQELPELASDGAGGAIVTWQDRRGINYDITARRVTAAGVAQWTTDGMTVCDAANVQFYPAIVADGRGGAIVAWYDARGGVGTDLYAQRIDGFGLTGDPAPSIVSVRDLPNDQGGHVRITWNASDRDTFPTLGVGAYGIWRQVTAAAAAAAPSRRAIRTIASGTQATYWEGVGSVLGRGEASYTFVADTFQDSTIAGSANTIYMVDAHDATLPRFWSSVPDSGHSIDNLAPAMPAPFTGLYSAGASHLDWGPSPEHDFASYTLYRGSTFGFTPDTAHRIAVLTGNHLDDPAPSGSFYKLSATDVHGNESGFAVVAFSTTDATGAPPARELVLERPAPNPAASTTTLRFALPRATRVSIMVYDAGGREFRRLTDGDRAAGSSTLSWDLRDESGRPAPGGIYWIRLRADGRTLEQRVALVR